MPDGKKGEPLDGDVFLPVGWLSEIIPGSEELVRGKSRPTRYACMLNISTKPMSMWLVFVYQTRLDDPDEEEENTWEIAFEYIEREGAYELTEKYQDDGPGTWHVIDGKRIDTPLPKTLFMGGPQDWIGNRDLLLLFPDIAAWQPYDDFDGKGADPVGLTGFLLGESLHAKLYPTPESLIEAQHQARNRNINRPIDIPSSLLPPDNGSK